MPESERNNFVYVMEGAFPTCIFVIVRTHRQLLTNAQLRNCTALAIDHHYSYEAKGGVEKLLKRNPKVTKNDYDFIRKLSKWNGGPINIYAP